MPFMPNTIEELAATGCEISINAADYMPQTLESVVRKSMAAGGFVVIRNSSARMPHMILDLAKLGGKRIRIEA